MQKRNLVIRISSKEDEAETRRFWLDKSPEERLDAVEFLREQYYVIRGYKEVPRLIKKLQMVER
ncbi:MAG: hypothetical protein EHM26_08825 [Desulfobacteraceae bacterium]|nr:MAG: hypothetical protein EHM26_08825 [Desulfobacteraceae bacterium]